MPSSVGSVPSKTLFSFIFFFLKKQWIKVLCVQALWFAHSIDQTIFPLVFGKIIDGFTTYAGDRLQAWPVLKGPILCAIFLWVSVEMAFRIGGFLLAAIHPKLEKQIRMCMFSHIHDQSQAYFSKHFTGDIATKISNMVDSISHMFDVVITLFIPTLGGIVIAFFTFYHLSPGFALLLLSWTFIHIGVSTYAATRCSHYSYIHAETRSRLNGRIVDSLMHYFTVKLFANKPYELAYVGALQREEQEQNRRQLLYIEKFRLLLGVLSFLGPGLALNGYAYWCWTHQQLSVGDMVLVFTTSWNLILMLWMVSFDLPNFFKEVGVCRQALRLMQDPIVLKDDPQAKPLKVSRGRIEFRKVHFHYKGSTPLFTNKSVVIEPGQKVGLVGYSGSGKSTFAHLILRLFDIQQGEILIDGQDISRVTQTSLREAIAVIPQDLNLFHRTLMENIKYGRIEASEGEVIEAAMRAQAHDFIMDLPEEYQTLAGEKGVSISGGQRQRIAIARAILKDAPLLILDEATSALDSLAEAQVQKSLLELMQGKTTLVIAHKLSTLLTMDRILVFEKGKIIEEGTHMELLKKRGVYYTLWTTQVDGFLPGVPVSSEAKKT